MTYQITFETEDGTVEGFATETSKARAMQMARHCAKGSALNEPMHVTRWFVEQNDQTISTHPVA